MDIILATRNPSKAEQIRAVFPSPTFNILMLDEVGVIGDAVEDGTTLYENAQKKVLFAKGQVAKPYWIMAEDTGLFITALGGKPGIHAARWAGDDATTEEILEYTLSKLAGKTDRTATFETVVVLISPEGQELTFSGKAPGVLLESPRMKPQPKMPYSAIFVPDGSSKTWAEMTVHEENLISHRGKAFTQVIQFLETKLAEG